MTVHFHEEDLPADALGTGSVAVDTETTGRATSISFASAPAAAMTLRC
jgi:hypothetical protein